MQLQLQINVRVAQRWAKAYQENPDGNFDKRMKGPKAMLGDAHKQHIIDLVDQDATVVVNESMESLTTAFSDLKISKSAVRTFMTKRM